MRVQADRTVCVGAGMCTFTAPEVFDQGEKDGRVVLLASEPPTDRRDQVAEAVEVCPSGAITVVETRSRREIPRP
ncbi:ferredoxin [Nocardiopsis nanhaiensis]